MRTAYIVSSLILIQASLLWAGGTGDPQPKKVLTDDSQTGAFTNKTERLLQEVRLPEVDFRQANINDILFFLNAAYQEQAKSEEAKQITITLDPDAQKELMKYEDYGNNSKGIFHLFTFSGLYMSVLDVVQALQTVAQLNRRVEGQKLILSMKAETNIPPENQVILKGDWTPTPEETGKALKAAKKFLEHPKGVDEFQDQINLILANWSKYRVQFTGVTGKGRKTIRCNFFCESEGESPDWKKREVDVDDGGFWYWHIVYDVLKGECLDFLPNGEA